VKSSPPTAGRDPGDRSWLHVTGDPQSPEFLEAPGFRKSLGLANGRDLGEVLDQPLSCGKVPKGDELASFFVDSGRGSLLGNKSLKVSSDGKVAKVPELRWPAESLTEKPDRVVVKDFCPLAPI
jgi:hypothetical protein